jgi:hypothetical protein
MKTKRRTEITIETERVVVSRRKLSVLAWCQICCRRVHMVATDEAAAIACVSTRTIFRWVETEKLHFKETSEGLLLICRESLPLTTEHPG